MNRLNVTGFWTGLYGYDDPGEPSVSFVAVLNDNDGQISGSISEPNSMGESSSKLHAFISGTRSQMHVDFAKVYDGQSDAAHRVDYSGRLSEDGSLITGMWTLETFRGPFSMTREVGESTIVYDEVGQELTTS